MSKLRKNDIMINPKTNRPLKVGGSTWLKLVKEGIVEGSYADPRELYTIQDTDDIDAKKEEFNSRLTYGEQAVKGRGRYAGKLVKRKKELNPLQVSKVATKAAARVLKRKIGESDEDINEELERLILQEMANKPKLKRKAQYVQEEEEEEDSEAEEEEEEEQEQEQEADESQSE